MSRAWVWVVAAALFACLAVAAFQLRLDLVSNSKLTASWHSDPADVVWETRNGPQEEADGFAERAGQEFAALLKVFPKR